MADAKATLELVLKARDEASEHVRGLGESLKRVAEIGAGIVLGAGLTELPELAHSFVESAAEADRFRAQLTALYGNARQAGEAFEYLGAQSTKMPFSVQDIRQAAAVLLATHQNVGLLLPALGNLAAAMGVDLPTAANAFGKAVTTGNLRGLQSALHLSRAELEQAGVQFDHSGKIVTSTLAPALERLAASKYGQAMAEQANTFTGRMTILGNTLDQVKEHVAQGAMPLLMGALRGLTDFLSAHMGDIERFATTLSHGLGDALQQVTSHLGGTQGMARLFQTAMRDAGAVLSGAWSAASALAHVLGGLAGALGTVLAPLGGLSRGGRDGEGAWKALGAVLVTGTALLWGISTATGAAKDAALAYAAATKGLAAVMAVWGALKVAVDALALSMLYLRDGEIATAAAAVGLNAAFLATPVGWVTLLLAGLTAGVIALEGRLHLLRDAWSSMQALAGEDPRERKDVAKALTPTGKLPGRDEFTMPGKRTGGDLAAFTGLAYRDKDFAFAYNMLVQHHDPQFFVDYLNKHAQAKAQYLAVMDKEGRGQTAREVLGGTSSLLMSGDQRAHVADLQKQYQDTLAYFQAEKKADPEAAMADLATLKDLRKQVDQAQGLSAAATVKDVTDFYKNLSKQIAPLPGADAGAGGIDIAGSPAPAPTAATDPKVAAAQLSKVLLTWKADVDKARHGELGSPAQARAVLDDLLSQIETLRSEAGLAGDNAVRQQTLDDLFGKVSTDAAKTTLRQKIAQFRVDLDKLRHHKIDAASVMAEVGLIGTLEGQAGATDTTAALNQQVQDIVDRQKGQAATATTRRARGALADATDHFKTDLLTLGVTTKDHARLLADVNRIKANEIGAHVRGSKVALDFAENMKKLGAHFHALATKAVAPYKQSGFDLARGASYGNTLVGLGPQRDQLVAHLQEQLREQRAQSRNQQKQIAILQDELLVATKSHDLLASINTNTAGTHKASEKTAQHVTKPQPRGGQHSFAQRTGTPFPI